MKCVGISTGNSSKDTLTWDEFQTKEYSRTAFGRLLIALVAETVWSSKYEVDASLSGDMYLNIHHSSFAGQSLVFTYDKNISDLSVASVEAAVRAHLRECKKAIDYGLQTLQGQSNYLGETLDRIDWDKAHTAIETSFPNADLSGLTFLPLPSDLYALGGIDSSTVYVARKVGNNFTGGVAQVHCSWLEWDRMGNGIKGKRPTRHSAFWVALARQFAAKELNISESELIFGWDIDASEKPFRLEDRDHYIVTSVTFDSGTDGAKVVVEFDKDNLPCKARVIGVWATAAM